MGKKVDTHRVSTKEHEVTFRILAADLDFAALIPKKLKFQGFGQSAHIMFDDEPVIIG